MHINTSVILVDKDDNEIGSCEKIKAHKLGLCHRAFSIFIFRKKSHQLQLLIQQRHPNKYHCGGLWTNTCCSHPFPGEETKNAAKRRLFEEIGIKTELTFAGKFHYIVNFNNGMTENEYYHVYVCLFSKNKININKNEISNTTWIAIEILEREIFETPEKYTPWFIEAFSIALNYIDQT